MKHPLLLLALLLAFACGGEEEPAETPEALANAGAGAAEGAAPAEAAAPPMPTITLTPEQTTKAAEVAALVTPSGTFPSAVTSDKTLGPVILHLAASSTDENVIVAALSNLSSSWTVSERYVESGYTLINDDFVGVIAARMHDERPRVLAAAIEGGGVGLRSSDTNEAILALFFEKGEGASPQLRRALIDKLGQSRAALENADRMQFFIDALSAPEAWLVSSTLFRIKGRIPSDDWAAPARAKVLELTRHENPGVRGRAAASYADIVYSMSEGEERAAGVARLVEMMSDENPYVKSEAINAQKTIRNAAALTAIAGYLGDETGNTFDITGFQTLTGEIGRVHHDGSGWSEVRDSALSAIKSLSYYIDRDNQFDYSISGRTSSEDLTAAAEAARTWVAAHPAE